MLRARAPQRQSSGVCGWVHTAPHTCTYVHVHTLQVLHDKIDFGALPYCNWNVTTSTPRANYRNHVCVHAHMGQALPGPVHIGVQHMRML